MHILVTSVNNEELEYLNHLQVCIFMENKNIFVMLLYHEANVQFLPVIKRNFIIAISKLEQSSWLLCCTVALKTSWTRIVVHSRDNQEVGMAHEVKSPENQL